MLFTSPYIRLLALISTSLILPTSYAGTSILREQQVLRVQQQREIWQLRWQGQPEPICAASDADMSLTCPCSGFAYGETARGLLLTRQVKGHQEQLDLSPLFKNDFDGPNGEGKPILQRWNVHPGDSKALLEQNQDWKKLLKGRPLTKLMRFGDYLHDGVGATFLLQVGELPCMKEMSVLIGISKSNPTLHVITSIAHPERPLALIKQEWEQLRRSQGSIRMTDTPCRDHGSDEESVLEMKILPQGVDAKMHYYRCTPQGKRGQFLNTELL